MKKTLKRLAEVARLGWAKRAVHRVRFPSQVRRFREVVSGEPTLEAKVDRVLGEALFHLLQKRMEVLGLIEQVAQRKPRRILEVGGFSGGTLCLFAQVAAPDAHLLSLDFSFTPERVRGLPEFAVAQQRVACLRCDSHAVDTLESVQRWFGGEPVDFLFIDGDHSYDGVRQDFNMYAPMVKAGGLIAFHDIVPDQWTRSGQRSENDAGEVPRFWTELKERGYPTEELVESPEQDGMGIGLLMWDGRVR